MSSRVLAEFMGSISIRLGEMFVYWMERSRERKRSDSRKGWVHHVKVEPREILFRARKCFRVMRVAYAKVSVPVLGRYS